MIYLSSYVQQGRSALRRWALEPGVRTAARVAARVLTGLCLSAASLAGYAQPLAIGFVCGSAGWGAVLAALGSAAGYWLFWGAAGRQMILWTGAGLALTLLLQRLRQQAPLLIPAAAALVVAVSGLLFPPPKADGVVFLVYLLRVLLAFGCTWLSYLVLQGRNPLLDWLACGLGVLALAQIVPFPYLGLGYVAAGMLTAGGAFPAAALAGLALDLAQVTPVPMTAVMALGYLVRFLPRYPRWMGQLAPVCVYIGMMSLTGKVDFMPLPGLLVGGVIGVFLPITGKTTRRRGETGAAQVRLEVAAGVLTQTRQLLLEMPPVPVDADALVTRAAERACGTCPYRKTCKDARRIGQLPGSILEKPLLRNDELPIICRKNGRFLSELHRSQEQLRSIHADRERQREYRAALMQQYQFLAEFLQEQADQLTRRAGDCVCQFTPETAVYGNRPEADNGDRCLRFSGTGGNYYVVLCDGMGTGLGAVQESRTAGTLLRRLLTAGYPAEHALSSLNSLCALRARAGAVTVDLVQIRLDTGKTVLYKWGAAPSYLVGRKEAQRIGAAGPPPGISVTEQHQTSHRLTLRRGQLLVLVSDGVAQEEALRICTEADGAEPGELAADLLSCARQKDSDDATVVMIRLANK